MFCVTGHDEDEDKAKMGTPLERMFLMAEAMLEAMKQFKSPDGKSLRIRVGKCSCPCNMQALLACRVTRTETWRGDCTLSAMYSNAQYKPFSSCSPELILRVLPHAQ